MMSDDHVFRDATQLNRGFSVLVYLAALPLLACLSDASSFDPTTAYALAQRTFFRGFLETAQAEASRDYQRSLIANPDWSRKFQILEATVMVWRGADEELLQLFEQYPASKEYLKQKTDEDIQQAALEATALIRLDRQTEAQLKLQAGDRLCRGVSPSPECGALLRAHGKFYLNNGQFDQAEKTYVQTVNFARLHKDRLLEGTALLNLATAVSKQDRHDEALDLYKASYQVANAMEASALTQSALAGEGWEYFNLGNSIRALELYGESSERASSLGDIEAEIQSLSVTALIYASLGQLSSAEDADRKAIKLAQHSKHEAEVADAAMDLAQLYITEGRLDEADRYTARALLIIKQGGDPLDILTCKLLLGESAALRHDWARADSLLHEVIVAPTRQDKVKWGAEHALANMYVAQGQPAAADQAYKAALAIVEGARGGLQREASQLAFLTNAARIYEDYIDFLVARGRSDEALTAADWSRARTLQQGLGLIAAKASPNPPSLPVREIARNANATLLFYWMGENHSYLWAVSPAKATLVTLPAKGEIVSKMQRYRRTLMALKDPLRENNRQGDKDGRELYDMLIAPVSGMVSANRPVVLFTDGEMSQLNFETLLVGSPTLHYWIDDATVSLSPSIRLFAVKNKSASITHDRLLLLGDSVSADPTLPHLPMAAVEVQKIRGNFQTSDEAVFSGAQATPLTYLASKPEQFSYIHFVAHGTANSTDPLESAIILSRDGSDKGSYKLLARDILQHPITARLVTISACNSSGTVSVAGEGVVGLSWAFLRAGAHHTIGTLWDVSDESTPELMDHLYSGLQKREQPATALRNAKLSLLHSSSRFSRPFYWAPFQLYSGH